MINYIESEKNKALNLIQICCDIFDECEDIYGLLALNCLLEVKARLKGNYEKVKVYSLSEKGENEIRYIGQTSTSLATRLNSHKCIVNNKSPKSDWINKVISKGNNIDINLIEENAVKDISETYFILKEKLINPKLLNLRIGGISRSNIWHHSEEAKKKMSLKRAGKKLSTFHRNRISEGQLGKIVSEEAKKNISIALTGKKLSLETRKKMSESRSGKKLILTNEERDRRRLFMKNLNKNHPKNIEARGVEGTSKV